MRLHASLEPLAFLLGTWRGEGEGVYPGVDPFRYREELTFTHVGDAFLLVTESSWTPDGHPLHFERGTLRPVSEGRVDLTLAHPIGVAEVAEGTLDGRAITTRSTAIARTATGSPVVEIERRYRLDDRTLAYELDMATDGVARTFHVRARLERVG
ncbi:MAG TPA: FABP family protein [Actinomycetota bacterium]|nr:FABP family protein [Actinomycetota bacterium]